MTVRNITNARGNRVANQFIIEDGAIAVFQSYESTVARIDLEAEKLTLGIHWDYSHTTMKHLYNFFREFGIELHNSKEVRKALETGDCYGKGGSLWWVIYDDEMI